MLASDRIPPDMTLAEILDETSGEYDSLVLQVQGRSVELGLIRKLHALLEQTRSADRNRERLT